MSSIDNSTDAKVLTRTSLTACEALQDDGGIYGFVSGFTSSQAMGILIASSYYDVPLVSPISSRVSLSSERGYFRVVPSDKDEATAFLALTDKFGWDSFSILYDENSVYAAEGAAFTASVAGDTGFKTNVHSIEVIDPDVPERALRRLQVDDGTRAIVLWCDYDTTRVILDAALALGLIGEDSRCVRLAHCLPSHGPPSPFRSHRDNEPALPTGRYVWVLADAPANYIADLARPTVQDEQDADTEAFLLSLQGLLGLVPGADYNYMRMSGYTSMPQYDELKGDRVAPFVYDSVLMLTKGVAEVGCSERARRTPLRPSRRPDLPSGAGR